MSVATISLRLRVSTGTECVSWKRAVSIDETDSAKPGDVVEQQVVARRDDEETACPEGGSIRLMVEPIAIEEANLRGAG